MAKTNQSQLESRINDIIGQAASAIAAAVRQDIGEQVSRIVGAGPARGAAPRLTNGGGAAKPAAAPQPGRKRRRRRGPDVAVMERLMSFIKSKPGLRSEEIRKQLQLDPVDAKAALAQLRADSKVRTKGDRRTTTYTVA